MVVDEILSNIDMIGLIYDFEGMDLNAFNSYCSSSKIEYYIKGKLILLTKISDSHKVGVSEIVVQNNSKTERAAEYNIETNSGLKVRIIGIHGLNVIDRPIDSLSRNAHDYTLFRSIRNRMTKYRGSAILIGDFNCPIHYQLLVDKDTMNSSIDIESPDSYSVYNISAYMLRLLNEKLNTDIYSSISGTNKFIPKGRGSKRISTGSWNCFDQLILNKSATKQILNTNIKVKYCTDIHGQDIVSTVFPGSIHFVNGWDHLAMEVIFE